MACKSEKTSSSLLISNLLAVLGTETPPDRETQSQQTSNPGSAEKEAEPDERGLYLQLIHNVSNLAENLRAKKSADAVEACWECDVQPLGL